VVHTQEDIAIYSRKYILPLHLAASHILK